MNAAEEKDQAAWFLALLQRALPEAADVGEALAAVDVALSVQPLPPGGASFAADPSDWVQEGTSSRGVPKWVSRRTGETRYQVSHPGERQTTTDVWVQEQPARQGVPPLWRNRETGESIYRQTSPGGASQQPAVQPQPAIQPQPAPQPGPAPQPTPQKAVSQPPPDTAANTANAFGRAGYYQTNIGSPSDGLADIEMVWKELKKVLPSLTKDSFHGLLNKAWSDRAIEMHTVNEKHKLTPNQRFLALKAPPLPGMEDEEASDYELVFVRDPQKLTQSVNEYLAQWTKGAAFSFDIFNRRAQGILNQALKASKKLTGAARKELKALLAKLTPRTAGPEILQFLSKYRLRLAELLGETQLASILEGAREVAERLPALPPTADQAAPPLQLPLSPSQKYSFPIIEEAAKLLAEKRLVSRPVFDRLSAVTRLKSLAVAGVDVTETLAKIRDTLSESITEDTDYEEWREKVLARVDEGTFLSDAHMEVVFRNNIQAAFSDGQMGVLQLPLVRNGFPYAAYESIHDDRRREEHGELEKRGINQTNVYRVEDPVFQIFRPPWDHNDRCSWIPLTIQQAAERGVKEAQRWLESGVEPVSPAYVEMPPFQPPPGFVRPILPPAAALSLESLAAFDETKADRPSLLAPALPFVPAVVGVPSPSTEEIGQGSSMPVETDPMHLRPQTKGKSKGKGKNKAAKKPGKVKRRLRRELRAHKEWSQP